MREATGAGGNTLPLAEVQRINEVCNRFELAWKAGERPRIEEYVGDAAGAGRGALVRELILLEVAYRRQRDEAPGCAEYQSRFPSLPAGWVAEAVAGPAPVSVGHYRMLEEVGRGGMGVVYRAEDLVLGREVAVKALGPEQAGSEAERRFAAEARITGRLEHPSIPPVHDLGTLPDGRPFLAMKLIRGKTLAERLKERPGPSAELDFFVEVFEKVCLAVAFAHSQRVIHRDLKPANVMVGKFGEVQVMDWGLAKVLGEPGEPAPGGAGVPPEAAIGADPEERTRAGQVLGTPAYMPPEQAQGRTDRIDERADVFALGGILCVILTGQPPYVGRTGVSVWRKAREASLADATARLDAVRQERRFAELAKRCLSPDPADRPPRAAEVAAEVRAARARAEKVRRQEDLDRATLEADQAGRRARRRSRLAVRLGCGGLFVGAVAAGGVWSYVGYLKDVHADRERRMIEVSRDRAKDSFPFLVAGVRQEAGLEKFRSGDAAYRGRVMVLIRQAAADQPPADAAFGFVVLAALAELDGNERLARVHWTTAAGRYAEAAEGHAEVELAAEVVRRFAKEPVPKLDELMVRRACRVLGPAKDDKRLPDPVRRRAAAALDTAAQAGLRP
jgi:serine/threonine protein kinase